MDEDCIFCKIIRGDFKTAFVAESERVVAFNDVSPVAPAHILVVPKLHITALRDLDDLTLGAEMLGLVQNVAELSGLLDTGYRLITNVGRAANQEILHLHWHLLAGDDLPGFE